MAAATFGHRLDLSAVRALLTSPTGGTARDLLRRGLRVETQAKRNLAGVGGPKRIDSGRLRSSIATQLTTRNGLPAVIVGTNVEYARFVHDGTGLYGPKHHLILPKKGKVMVWPAKGTSAVYGKKKGKFKGKVVAQSTKGIRPNRFLANALTAARR